MRPFIAGFCLIFALSASDRVTFRSTVTSVKVDAQVLQRGASGLVADLTRDDFRVFDENAPREISYFGREQEPLDLVLLLDVSGTMREVLQNSAEQACAALAQLHSGDRVSVIVFGRDPVMAQPFTDDFALVKRALPHFVADTRAGSDTEINKAVLFTADYLRLQGHNGRRAILIVSDNIQGDSIIPDIRVVEALYEADAVLNGVIVTGAVRLPNFLRLHRTIYHFAAKTGGETVEGSRPGERLGQMIDRIRTRYTMQFTAPPAASSSFHRIRVELTPEARRQHPRALVRARAGYFPLASTARAD